MTHKIPIDVMECLQQSMIEDEKSTATIEKYLRDVRCFITWLADREEFDKQTVIEYKTYLVNSYAAVSVNSMLAALNYFLGIYGWQDCRVKQVKIQRDTFRDEKRELTEAEYRRILTTAYEMGNIRLGLIIETIGATGIRISELQFITVEAAQQHRASVSLKGKTRSVLLPKLLCKKLTKYAKEHELSSGSIFVTRTGRPIDRTNVLHGMKQLADKAKVDRAKLFPHNLRHLFAVVFYKKSRDVVRLADVLGHSNINTTRLYTSISAARQQRQIETLGMLLL